MVDWPISIADVNAAEDIFRKYEGYLQENIMWSKLNHTESKYI